MSFSSAPMPTDPEIAELLGEVSAEAYRKYTKGLQAVVDSLDVPVGLTPREEIWRLNKTRLYRYQPVLPPEERYPVPLLLVYALINKPFIFDLVPGRSFIEFLLERGFDVYLLDWGSPGLEDQHITFDEYVTRYLTRAVRTLLRKSGAAEISVLGYCLGATLTVVFASLYPQVPIRNIILLTAPIDYAIQQDSMAVWLEEGRLDVERILDIYGNVPGELIRFWAKMLKPIENFIGIYVNLWKQIGDEHAIHAWQAINRWVEDVVPFAGAAFQQYVQEYVRENQLIRGVHEVDGQRVDLGQIEAAFLNIAAQYDHLVALPQAETVMDEISSQDKTMKVIPSTHVGLMVSSNAEKKLWPVVVDWLGPRSRAENVSNTTRDTKE